MERGEIYSQRCNDETLAMKILTAAEMREVDRLTTERYGIPSLSLMENAGKSIADFMSARFRRLESRRIIVLCGKGNNGGDGFVTARHLADAGATPIVILVAAQDEMRGDAATNRDHWQKSLSTAISRGSLNFPTYIPELGRFMRRRKAEPGF